MNRKFEDIMRVGYSRSTHTPVESPPDAVGWVNLLTAFCFTTFCTLMCGPEGWQDGLFYFMFFGMILGPVIFMMGSGFSEMCGGTSSWWISVSVFVITVIVCLYFLYKRYGLGWL
ncbi:MAG: hypothetical protein AB8F34_13850 [Akkermansiaceae bacterium]